MDWGFTIVFAVELMLNIYAHWMDEFLADAWNIFDTIVVVISLVAPLLTAQNIPVTILRLLRAFRVLRLFGRLRSIRAIINALSKSIVPVANAFFIQFIVMALLCDYGRQPVLLAFARGLACLPLPPLAVGHACHKADKLHRALTPWGC